jgi:hypothetical protein
MNWRLEGDKAAKQAIRMPRKDKHPLPTIQESNASSMLEGAVTTKKQSAVDMEVP